MSGCAGVRSNCFMGVGVCWLRSICRMGVALCWGKEYCRMAVEGCAGVRRIVGWLYRAVLGYKGLL